MQIKQLLVTGLIFSMTLVQIASAETKPTQSERKDARVVTTPNHKLPPAVIPSAFPFKSHFVDVHGSRIHYIDEGKGSPVIFIHGNPTSSYLWRNIIPYVTDTNRAIAPDLIGMGKSDKPNINYTFIEHYQYIEAFIKQLDLNNITFVVHDWGAAIGFEYARRHPKRVKAITFMEGVLPPAFPQPSFDAMGKEMGGLFRMLKDPVKGKQMIIDNNGFVEQLLPAFTNRTLGKVEMEMYRAPFATKASRKPTLIWPLEIPVGGQPASTTASMKKIEQFMAVTEIPMLLLYASPGAIIPPKAVPWYENKIKNLETTYIGQSIHYIQEDQPDAVGRALNEWMRRHHN